MANTDWRPTSFDQYIGQKGLVELLKDQVDAAKAMQTAVSHTALYSVPGLGKTTIAELIAMERGVDYHMMMGKTVNQESLTELFLSLNDEGYSKKDPKKPGSKGGLILDRSLIKPPVICFDEAESVQTAVWETLHHVFEPSPDGRRLYQPKVPGRRDIAPIWVPECTFVLLTNYFGELRNKAAAVLSRTPIQWQLELYTPNELFLVLQQFSEQAGVPIDDDAALFIAERSNGIPRDAIALFKQAMTRISALKHRGQDVPDIITVDIVNSSADLLKIDDKGLREQHRRYLRALAGATGGKMALATIAAVLGTEDLQEIRDLEKPLLQQELVQIVPGGRMITPAGLDLAGPEHASPLLGRLA